VKMYACGPTVYNYIHIGNARPICLFDTFRRYLEFKGYKVKFVQNFTDIDDKIIKKANEEGIDSKEVAKRYIEEYKKDAKGLGVREASVHPKATETIKDIIKIVKALVDNGYAYESNGDVYFRTKKFDGYGKLSHQTLDDLGGNDREVIHDVSDQKEDSFDFALWKAAKPDEPAWGSPWGKGRPGWHIECTAMINNHLGETIDIHCGGQDLIFPHHENEIAQAECYTGKDYAHYWIHNGYINVDNKKMSKSLNNFFTVRDVAEKYGYEPIKYLMLQAHYRMPINYSTDIIEQCKASLDRLYSCKENMEFVMSQKSQEANENIDNFKQTIEKRRQQFIDAMEDDFNTADAISAMFDMAKDINIFTSKCRNYYAVKFAYDNYMELANVLGILYEEREQEADAEILELIEKRQQARKDKDFAKSDEIRDELLKRGIMLKDTADGVKWSYIK
ncbi:MAG: cysteine--tRNA ligase, partial [Oscillospiraceae bacterium]